MKLGGRNLSEWLRRGGDTLPSRSVPFAEFVQPVELVGDGSRLTSPQIPPSAIAGSDNSDAGAYNVAWSFQALAPGGALIREAILSAQNAIVWAWQIAPTTNPDAAISNLCPNFNMNPAYPCRSRLLTGLPAAGITGQYIPLFYQAVNRVLTLTDLYVPAGYYFYVENNTITAAAGTMTMLYLRWEEYPSAP